MLEKQTSNILKDVPEKDAQKIKKIVNGLTRLTFVILKFLATLYIFNRIYDRIGFDKTIITLLVIIIIILINQNRKDFLK